MYLWGLLLEYSILDAAQVFSFMKRFGEFATKGSRKQASRALRGKYHMNWLEHGGRRYFSAYPRLLPIGRYRHQIACFWVLMDYFKDVGIHYSCGTFFQIHMEIEGKSYQIGYVEQGAETLCNAHMAAGGDTRYVLVLEDLSQRKLLHPGKITSIATVPQDGKVLYYRI